MATEGGKGCLVSVAAEAEEGANALLGRLLLPAYAGHFQVRWVGNAGTFRFQCKQLFLSDALKQKWIGLEEVDDGIWAIYFYDVLLARLDERDRKLHA